MPNTARKIEPLTTTKTATREKRYMPLKLKIVLAENGIRQAEWQNAITQDGIQKKLSSSAGTSLLNWNTWPKNTSEESIKTQTVIFIKNLEILLISHYFKIITCIVRY